MTIEQLTNEDIAAISAESKIFLGPNYFSSNTTNQINSIIQKNKTTPDKISETVRTQLQKLFSDFDFSLTK